MFALQVYAAGIKNIDLYFIITEVAGPVILFLSLSVVLPYVLAEAFSMVPGKLCCRYNRLCIPYSSKFLWSNIFVIFVNYTEILKYRA